MKKFILLFLCVLISGRSYGKQVVTNEIGEEFMIDKDEAVAMCNSFCPGHKFERMGQNAPRYFPAVEYVCLDTSECNSENKCTINVGLKRWDYSFHPVENVGGVTCAKAIAKK